MKTLRSFRTASFALLATLSLALHGRAENPIVQTIYTADPAPMVHEGTVYLYTGHDEDDAPNNKYLMHDYQLFTTTDMVNWTHKGPVLDIKKTFSWSGGDANAAQVIFRNGKFYYYVSTGNTERGRGGVALGVAVADKPEGPFKDALGHALVRNDETKAATHGWDDLDPTVFLDTDGKAYLYWGNNACYAAELNDDMISLKGPITSWVQTNKEVFGPDFEEAPWFYKRNDLYYLVYASQFPEFIRYATAKSPLPPQASSWTYRGTIMTKPTKNGLGTNHPGIADYQGHSYIFYHTADLPRGGDKRRCVAIEEFTYNPDGTIPEIKATAEGVKPLGTLNPFNKVEAETIAWESGIKTAQNDTVGVYVTVPAAPAPSATASPSSPPSTPYIKVRAVDFTAKGAATFRASVAASAEGCAIELHLDSESGPVLGTLQIKPTGGLDKWETQSTPLTGAKGVHDLFLKFPPPASAPGKQALNFDWWKCE
jgi:hypothetical protein